MRRTLYRVTQENLIENSVQGSLPYTSRTYGPCELFLTYSKQPCVILKANIYVTYGITLFFQNLLYLSMHYMTMMSSLALTPSSKDRQIKCKKKKIRNEKGK